MTNPTKPTGKPKEIELTREQLLELFTYDREAGKLFWKVANSNRVKVGAEAGSLSQHGYLVARVDGRPYRVHRLIWIIEHGSIDSSLSVDHINGNRDNNRIENLRLVTSRENSHNQRRHRENTKSSRFVGVSWCKRAKKWRASIRIGGKLKHLGLFSSEEESDQAYQNAIQTL